MKGLPETGVPATSWAILVTAGSTLSLVAGLIILGYYATQSAVVLVYLGYGLAFVGYGGLLWRGTQVLAFRYYLLLAVLLRILLIFAFPSLTDDVYRFVWDGRLWLAGYNPFDHLPSWYEEQGFSVPGLTASLYAQLNSPEYFTIYPPVAQAVFVFGVWWAPDSVTGAAILMKLWLLAAEIGSLWLLLRLLTHWQLPPGRVLWYALNPLVLVELMANLHFEALLVFFLLLSFWLLVRGYLYWGSLAFALSVASKLLPLMFLPLLIRRLGWGRSFRFFGAMGLASLLLWLPLLNATFVTNFGASIQLYFRQFEFNASIYYLLREIGYHLEGYNLIKWIGPRLALLVLLLILARAWWEKDPDWRSLPGSSLFAVAVYLFLATTVHPWYSILPLVLCVFTPWRWPVLWTALIPLTYINYSYPEYYENLTVVVVEYSMVFAFALGEYLRRTPGLSASSVVTQDQEVP
jgi:hypothetical protein